MIGTAVVVGGGIGGLATAVGLSRGGWDVRVFEQAAAFAPVGAGLGLGPNAVAALDWLGVGDRVRAIGRAPNQAGIRASNGPWLLRLDPAEVEARFGNPWLAIHRAELHDVLLDATPTVTYLTDHKAVGVTTSGREATVIFETADGRRTHTADLVVAADGVHSRLRAELFPQFAEATYGGYVCWRGIVPADRARDITAVGALVESWGRSERLGMATLGDGRVYWFGCPAAPAGSYEHETLHEVAARFAGWHHPIPQLLAATPPESLIRSDVYYFPSRLPTYVSGRVVLLGDAAHAPTPDIGQGAGFAIEDAVVLAAALGEHDDLRLALGIYDEARRPRTQRLARLSGRLGRLLEGRTALGATVRNAMARVMPPRLALRATQDMFAWRPPA